MNRRNFLTHAEGGSLLTATEPAFAQPAATPKSAVTLARSMERTPAPARDVHVWNAGTHLGWRELAYRSPARRFFALCSLVFLLAPFGAARNSLDLAGEWRLHLDPRDEGVSANWPAAPLQSGDRITLPNTTDRAGFGFALDTTAMLHTAPFPVTTRFPGVKEPVRADEHGYLVRRHLFVGPAWYEREVNVPEAWKGRPVTLRLERAIWRTEVWVDGLRVSECDSLVAEHRHELGTLAPGPHRLTIRVDNRMIHNLSTITHAYGPETQSRWNGLIGALTLEAAHPVAMRSLDVFPAPDRHSARVVARVTNTTGQPALAQLRFRVLSDHDQQPLAEKAVEVSCPPGLSTHDVPLQLTEPAQAWDEFQPTRYRLIATMGTQPDSQETATVAFGFRHVERVGRELRLNGRPIFLRGTLDCAVYPKTGHPPMPVTNCSCSTISPARAKPSSASSIHSGNRKVSSAPPRSVAGTPPPCCWRAFPSLSGPPMKPSPHNSKSPTSAAQTCRTKPCTGRSMPRTAQPWHAVISSPNPSPPALSPAWAGSTCHSIA